MGAHVTTIRVHSLGPSDEHAPEGSDGAEEAEDREEEVGCEEEDFEKEDQKEVAVTLLRENRTARRFAGPFRF